MFPRSSERECRLTYKRTRNAQPRQYLGIVPIGLHRRQGWRDSDSPLERLPEADVEGPCGGAVQRRSLPYPNRSERFRIRELLRRPLLLGLDSRLSTADVLWTS